MTISISVRQCAAAAAAFVVVGCSGADEPAASAQTAEAEHATQGGDADDQKQTEVIAAYLAEYQPRFEAAPAPSSADGDTAWQFEFDGLTTSRVPMTAFEGEVVLVVNTASECGYTPQYEGLQTIFEEYHAQGFEIVGVPSNDFGGQEPGSAEDIQTFCALNYGVGFPMASKYPVTGDDAHPFYKWAATEFGESAVPQWNFHKVLVGRDGRVIAAFPSAVEPTADELRSAITSALDA